MMLFFNDTILIRNLDMTDQEIRMRIERLSLISGTYIGKYNSKGNFTLTKLKKNIKRAPSWSPETWRGSASTDADINSNAKLQIELDYFYSETEKCYVNCKSASVTVRNYDNGYFEEENYDVDVSNENTVFSGRQSFDYYATIKCSEDKFSGTWNISCNYDSGTLSCEIY